MLGSIEGLSGERDSHVESKNKGEKPIEKPQKPKDEEEYVKPTLNTGNWLIISIEEFLSETEDDGSMLDTQEQRRRPKE